jgi:hypothetical protein
LSPTHNYTQGKPYAKARARAKARNFPRDGKLSMPACESKAELMRLMRWPESLAEKVPPAERERLIRELDAAAKASPDGGRKIASDAKRKPGDRFLKNNRFTDHGIKEAKLSMPAQIVWYHLWRHEWGGVARASVDEIATNHNISKRSVYDGLAELKKVSMLQTVERGNSRTKCSTYRLFPSPLKESATSAPDAPVEQSATGAPGALTGAPGALTGAPGALTGAGNDTPTEGQNVSGRSVLRLQNGRSDPDDVRSGTARPVLPTSETNSDGGTIPLSPPSKLPRDELEFRPWVTAMGARGIIRGDESAQVYSRIMDYLDKEGADNDQKQWANDSLVRLLGAL